MIDPNYFWHVLKNQNVMYLSSLCIRCGRDVDNNLSRNNSRLKLMVVWFQWCAVFVDMFLNCLRSNPIHDPSSFLSAFSLFLFGISAIKLSWKRKLNRIRVKSYSLSKHLWKWGIFTWKPSSIMELNGRKAKLHSKSKYL